MEKFKEILRTTEVLAGRLCYALGTLQPLFPISAEKVSNLDEQELLRIVFLTTYFSKLQDYMGAKLFDVFLETVGVSIDQMTPIDKVNMLEKLGIIEEIGRAH